MPLALGNICYIIAAALFIFGLKGLAHPRTAVRGNLLGALGMLLAIVVTLLTKGLSLPWILSGILIGSAIGAVLATKIEMTAMPEMVGLLNGFGGGASVLVAGGELIRTLEPSLQMTVATALSGLIGSVTLLGSLVAFGKLREYKWIPDGHLFPGHNWVNLVIFITCLLLGYLIVSTGQPEQVRTYWLMAIVASVLGVMLVIPIGGADMPVVISLLNSYSGLAAAATGFVINNNVLIIAGSLVGSSGIILTRIMCKAMNRSLANVLFGGLLSASAGASKTKADDVYAGKVKGVTPDEVALLFDGARRVVVVPGYGMAVAQAQHTVRDLANLLESRGMTVDYAIHPVAGRMPGHMNVLLAEAGVDYDKLLEMDAVNPTFNQTDVVLVIGANDVVNPLARTDPGSPIAGMPILNVDEARTVVVVKRSLSPGFAGIPNPLFALPNTYMMFGDGKKALLELIAALKAV